MRGFVAAGFGKTGLFTLVVVALLTLSIGQTRAQNLPIDTFFGHYQGSGVAENQDSLYFGVTVRDLDVRIGAGEGESFTVEWTSVIRGGGDPNKPNIQRKSQKISFRPSDNPKIYLADEAQDPTDDGLVWARIIDHTLSINVMRIDADGGYTVQTYNRILEGTGMRLRYISVSDGEPNRVVEARLVKVGQ